MDISPFGRFGGKDRRAVARQDCARPDLVCVVTGPPGQTRAEAALWDLSPAGACLVVESLYLPGERLRVALGDPAAGTRLRLEAEVKHIIRCPTSREMWLTGCAFLREVAAEDLPRLA
jgi:hypothetical protein